MFFCEGWFNLFDFELEFLILLSKLKRVFNWLFLKIVVCSVLFVILCKLFEFYIKKKILFWKIYIEVVFCKFCIIWCLCLVYLIERVFFYCNINISSRV